MKAEIIQGDCLDIMRTMGDKSVDLILTDPPYGIGLKYNSYDDTEAHWYDLMHSAIPHMRRVSKMVIFPCCAIKRLGWFYEHHKPDWLMCWHKGSPGHAAYIGFNDWEPLIVYGKLHTHMHDHLSVNNIERMGNYGHPCPKPVAWASWIIKRACESGNTVLDPFVGSGTTGVAAVALDCKFIGIELDPIYADIARKRIANAMPLFTGATP